jgi:hypothetical protein
MKMQMGYVFQRTGLPSVDPSADPAVLIVTPFTTEAEASAAAEADVGALNAAWSAVDTYTFSMPQWTPPGTEPLRFAVLVDEYAPPGVPVPEGARLEEIGDAWYQPAW